MDIGVDKEIDKYNLDIECAHQHALYNKYGIQLADVEYEYDIAKNTLAVTEADLALSMRKAGCTPDGGKITEGSIREALQVDVRVKELSTKLAECGHEVKLVKAAMGALEHKKSMLSNLVALQKMEYYKISGEMAEVDNSDIINEKLVRNLNKNRSKNA